MIERTTRLGCIAPAVAIVVAVTSCGATPITPGRIEPAIASTFANRVHLQVSAMGLPPITVAGVAATASCRKPGSSGNTGSGEWICILMWQSPERQILRDTFDVVVTTDGCYTATAEAASLGGPVLESANGGEVTNLLYTFEGCFDTM